MVGSMPTVTRWQSISSAVSWQARQVAANSSLSRVKVRPVRAVGLPFSSTLKLASSGTTRGLSSRSRKSWFFGRGLP